MRTILLIALLLTGCGSAPSNNHGYGFGSDVVGATGLRLRYSGAGSAAITDVVHYETVYELVKTCVGASAPAPFIIVLPPGGLSEVQDISGRTGFRGMWYSDPSLIVIDDIIALRHEMIHHIRNDPEHVEIFFRCQ